MKPFERTSYRDYAYNYIKEKILSAQYGLGERINIAQISNELELSNAPIREAISLLESEGLVVTVPFSGTKVVDLTPEDMLNNRIATTSLYLGCYSMCRALGLQAELAANYESALLAQMNLPNSAPPYTIAKVSIAVDQSFVETLKNKTATAMSNVCLNQSHLEAYMDFNNQLKTKDSSIREHMRILSAIKRDNYNDVEQCLLQHYQLDQAQLRK